MFRTDFPYKRGKSAPKFHVDTLNFEQIIAADLLPSPATKVFREYKTPVDAMSMFGNDRYGDCVWALLCNHIILTSVHTGNIIIPTTAEALAGYAAVTGFRPGPPVVNDNGTSMTDALAYWMKNEIAGVKILAWVKIDHTNRIHRELGVDLFSSTLTGVALPDNAQDQFLANQPWNLWAHYPPDPNEGHAILHPGYGPEGDDYVSWARWDQKADLAWSNNCVDEEYVVVTPTWLNRVTKLSPPGLNLPELMRLLRLLGTV